VEDQHPVARIENQEQALAIIGKTAQLEFYDVADFEPNTPPQPRLWRGRCRLRGGFAGWTSLVFWSKDENGQATATTWSASSRR